MDTVSKIQILKIRMNLWWPEMHVKDNNSDAYAGKILILVYSPNPTTNSKTTNQKKKFVRIQDS